MEAEATSPNTPQGKVWKPSKSKSSKPGIDRRLKIKSKAFDQNLHKKLAGEEIPKSLKVSW